jgi:four helix bundle protein
MMNSEYRIENTGRRGSGDQGTHRRGKVRAPVDIAERTFQFGLRILKVLRAVPRDPAGQVIGRQLLRCGTSVGANVAEAQGLHTRRDFARRMNTARTEARETVYWLRLITESAMLPARRLGPLMAEADEITRVLTAIVKNARREESP